MSQHLYKSQGVASNLDNSALLHEEIMEKSQKLEQKALTFEKLKYSMKETENYLKSKEKYKKVQLAPNTKAKDDIGKKYLSNQ